jgi:predicted nuclease of predicted toxin-antitoxin system
MKIKLDQNISQYLRDELAEFKHDVDTIVDEGLSGTPDAEVLQAAASRDRILFYS